MAASLQPNEAAFSFQCVLCDEDVLGIPIPVDIRCNYVVCQQCGLDSIVPMLLMAAESEYHFPPRWGTQMIFSERFHHLLPSGFCKHYGQKMFEYTTPLAERIYCRAPKLKLGCLRAPKECGHFLDRQISTPYRGPGTPFACFACDHCSDYAYRSCAHCGEVCSTPTPGLGGHKLPTCFTFPHFLDHTCRDLTSDRADDALEGHSRPRLSAMPQATMQAPGGAIVWLQSVVLCKFGLQDIVLRNMWRRGQPRQWSLESRQPVSAMEQAWTAQRSIRRPSGRRPRSNHCS